ncbi:serine/threonine-protein kinase [Streptomyces pristinaespiralis]|uniref:non-specific serine/threonine protein kinase n=2 Tax=Streptomyces pristinaespiralis TaxID=38300 RepID=A0A0M4DIP0_STRPR|nr:serine/threonine-protein kinase [Streptomyces pristinaespiralis]ALC21417.1 serine/threonine protein kinase [Streptomyces pristinaespiralis]QMU15859.1 serine/threonine protein kinase [Streptomyces pristinaespiralis]
MSEAEQSRKPQRGAGFAGEDADSAAGAGIGSAGLDEGSAAGAADPKAAEADARPEAEDAVPEIKDAPSEVKDAAPADKSDDGDVKAGAAEPADAVADGAAAEAAEARKPGHGTGGGAVTTAQDDMRKDPRDTAQGPARSGPSAETKPAAPKDAKPLSVTKAGTRPAEPAGAPAAEAASGGVSAAKSGASPADGGRGAGSQAAAAKAAPADRTGRAGGGAAAPVSKGRGATGSEGRLLAGRYRLGGVLGRGGMGTVWRAVDETLGRTVAVKELRFPNSIDDDEKRRLITRTLREAKAIARIRNNSAVTVYDVVDEDDRPWIVMELVEGKSLAEVVREDGVLTPRRAAEVGLAILDVLRSAHREGILHRDVKPSNVLIGRDGRVVLTDFGIAQVEGDPSITSTGMLVGAPSYISPERARGHKPGPAADLWSLGGLLYASVEGCPPYDKGSAIATLTAVMTEPLDPPKNAGPLEEVIYGLLAKDPAQRLDDAGARALLTQVVNAPEAPVLPPEPEPSPEATRAIRLPSVPPVPPAGPKDPAADRVRGALRSVRNAAAAVKAESKPKPAPGGAARRAAPVRAPLTDVVPRRTLVIIAAVALLAVLSTVLVFALDDDDPVNRTKGKDETAASAGSTAGAGEDKAAGGTGSDASPDSGEGTGKDDGKEEEDGGQGGTGSPDGQPSGDPKDDASAGGDTLPAGYVMVSNDRWHFTMAMPANFKLTGVAGQNSGGKFSVDGGVPRVQVDFNNSPKDDAAAAWAAAVAGVSATSNGYKHLGIGTVEYKGYPTVADWQFERNENGQRVRILNRGFKVDARRGYSIMITCKASEWRSEECETLRRTAFATFSPKD